jgi:dihydroorotase
VLIADGVIRIGIIIDPTYKVIDGTGKHLLPGIIDGQVHFRDPGLTHKEIYIQKVKLLAGGVTSFIDMPNTVPNILTVESLKEKYAIASKKI